MSEEYQYVAWTVGALRGKNALHFMLVGISFVT